MAEITEIKASFEKQVKAEFENSCISSFADQDWQKGIELLFELTHSLNDGINFMNALEEVLINKPTDYNALVSFVNYLENYLTLIGDLTGKTAALDKSDKSVTLMPLIKAILPKKPPNFDCEHRADIDKYRQKSGFVAHIYRAYCTRNDVNHSKKHGELPDWASDQIAVMQNRNSVLVVLLFATLVHEQALKHNLESKQLSEQPKLVSYLEQVVKNYEKWQQRFVAIHTTEKIELYAQEDLDEVDQEPRQDTVENLHQRIPMLMVLGEAGMGKTTTLQYLAWEAAKKCQAALKNPVSTQTPINIPIYLELKLFTGEQKLSSEILRQLSLDTHFAHSLLEEGKISLFLDGLNEVSKSLQQEVINQIQSLIKRYPKVQLLISSRRSYEFKTSDEQRVPVFALKKMTQAQIEEFLQRNTDKSTRQIIQASISNQRILNWLRVPMLLKMMIEVMEERQQLPKNKNELIENFIDKISRKIYSRERERDSNFSETTYEALIRHLAGKIYEQEETNAALKESQVIKILNEKVNSGFPNADLDYFLKISTELGFLTKDDDLYSFTHQEFFDYYAAQSIEFDF